jgi:hypothetical protein
LLKVRQLAGVIGLATACMAAAHKIDAEHMIPMSLPLPYR